MATKISALEQALIQDGFVVKVKNFHAANSEPSMRQFSRHGKTYESPHITHVVIRADGRDISTDKAVCSPKDQIDKSKGRYLAIKRAVQKIGWQDRYAHVMNYKAVPPIPPERRISREVQDLIEDNRRDGVCD